MIRVRCSGSAVVIGVLITLFNNIIDSGNISKISLSNNNETNTFDKFLALKISSLQYNTKNSPLSFCSARMGYGSTHLFKTLFGNW